MRIHPENLAWQEEGNGKSFGFLRKRLGQAAGSEKLGCSLYCLAPGKISYPRHYHLANEEALYILSGNPTLELGEETLTLRPGDYVALPARQDHAHLLRNDTNSDATYLCLSTMLEPEVVIYPDSNKLGVMAGSPPGGDKSIRTFQGSFSISPIGYYDGEEKA